MISIPYEELISMILEKKQISRDELESRIKAKMSQLSGLISNEGAAHIVANELGLRLFDSLGGKLKVGKILSGMRDVETLGKVLQVFEVHEFQGKMGPGKVGAFMMGDETGQIRVVLWNETTKQMEKITPGMIVKIVGAQARQNRDRKELHLISKSKLILNPPGETVGEVKLAGLPQARRLQISELTGTEDSVEIKATIVQVFDLRFYEVCPECLKRVKQDAANWRCDTHGTVKPAFSYVLNLIVDDGSGNIRVVCFGSTVEAVTGKPKAELLKVQQDPAKFEDVKNELLGLIMVFTGKANKNEMFDRIEFVARYAKQLDVNKEIEALKARVGEEKQKPVEQAAPKPIPKSEPKPAPKPEPKPASKPAPKPTVAAKPAAATKPAPEDDDGLDEFDIDEELI